jgi:hypothetical protein
MHLHPDEEIYFSKGSQPYHIEKSDIKVVNAICADTNHSQHVEYCAEIGACVCIPMLPQDALSGTSSHTRARRNMR